MNCFTHALPFLDDPYLAVGACVPDWLSALDRKVRARERLAEPFVNDPDPIVSALARGVIQHHQDDDWFHQTRAFAELNMILALEVRDLLGGEAGFRPGLMGHIVIELFLDAYLHQMFPGKLDQFYDLVDSIDADKAQQAVNRFATRPATSLSRYITHFRRERYIFDYSDDKRLIYRINRVFQRVKLRPIGDELKDWMPGARTRVYAKADELLEKYPLSVKALGEAL